MANQDVLFTACPNGLSDDGSALLLSVFVQPRLKPSGGTGVLGDFPDLREWPALLSQARITVTINGAEMEADFDRSRMQLSLWKRLFSDETPVGTPVFPDLSSRELRSFPVRRILHYIRDLYQYVAERSPTEFPSTDPKGPLGNLRTGLGASHPPYTRDETDVRTEDELKRLRESSRQPGYDDRTTRERSLDQQLKNPATATVAQEALDFYQATRFYNRPEMREVYGPLDPSAVPPPPKEQKPDFHQFINSLSDFPQILRDLGLVVDLTVPFDGNIATSGEVWLQVDVDGLVDGFGPEPFPHTAYIYDGRYFQAAPTPGAAVDLNNGMLMLDNPDLFDLVEIDIDGAAIKVDDFAANLERMLSDEFQATHKPDNASLPALRSSGISVTRWNRSYAISDRISKAKSQNANYSKGGTVFYAEDLIRGYRLDVFDDNSNDWHSLCEREGSYSLNGALVVHRDECIVREANVTSKPQDETAPIYLHEAVFGWDGWSLAVKRPGKTIADTKDGEKAKAIEEKASNAFNFEARFEPVEGVLPRLRYGWNYRLRARSVDLAGNSVSVIDERHESRDLTYRRFEPVPPPVLVPTAHFTEGESLQRLVVRSNVDLTPDQYVKQDYVKEALSQYLHHYDAFTDRHFAAPKISQQIAELHERFEASIGASKDYRKWFNIAAKEAGSFLDRFIVDVATGEATIPVPGIELVTPLGTSNPADLNTLKKGDPLAAGQYVIHKSAQLLLPYLPDPLSLGVAFSGLPDVPAGVVARAPWNGVWPDATPFRLRLVGADQAPSFTLGPNSLLSFDEGELRVRLAQGDVVKVKVSSFLQKSDLDQLGIWGWMLSAAQAKLMDAATDGQCWMLTPYDEITLVHAVQQPLAKPVLPLGFVPARLLNETFCWFDGRIDNHAKTTAQLDVEAVWSEPVDIVTDPEGPKWVDAMAHVFDFKIEPFENAAQVGRDDVAASATTPARHRAHHDFGDTKHRMIRYTPVASTRFREYFPPEITRDKSRITQTGETVELNVPSSARPDAPKVLYVVPTFKWEAAGGRSRATEQTRKRIGGLRVYLDRPWYSSGDGELLGVVVRQPKPPRLGVHDRFDRDVNDLLLHMRKSGKIAMKANTRADLTKVIKSAQKMPLNKQMSKVVERVQDSVSRLDNNVIDAILGDQVYPYVTHWGVDPIWEGAALPSEDPTPSHFTHPHLRVGEHLTLSELSSAGTRVAVVGHAVEYNAQRRLWFCDIDIDAGASYFPFVRLALARYQPNSIENAELSKVVVADFAQLVAERTATISRRRLKAVDRLEVAVSGPAGVRHDNAGLAAIGIKQSALDATRRVVVTVQEQDPAVPTDLGWENTDVSAELSGDGIVDGIATWRGGLTLPSGQGRARRLLIEEYERLPVDPQLEGPGQPMIIGTLTGERLIYVDTIPLDD